MAITKTWQVNTMERDISDGHVNKVIYRVIGKDDDIEKDRATGQVTFTKPESLPSDFVAYDKLDEATVIKKDGVDIGARSYERYVLQPGTLDASDNLVDNPLDKEPDGVTAIPAEVSAICNAVWTTDVKTAWKAKLIADKLPS